jgi:hypothetical protein
MQEPTGEYQIVSQVHVNNLNADGTVTPGWTVTARDLQTGVTFPVFIADDKRNADNVRSLILYELNHIRSIHGLSD